MVMRGYPEENAIGVEEPINTRIEAPKEVIKYVYVPVPQNNLSYPANSLQLDPNIALITFGIIVAAGIFALAIIYKK